VALIPREVFLVDEKVMVRVQLPEATVENVEMLVRKVLADFIDIFLIADHHHRLEQVRVLEVSERDVTIVICVKNVEYAHYDCVGIPLLELWRLLEKF